VVGRLAEPAPRCTRDAPKHWLGFASGVDEPARVIPERWVSMPVRDPPQQSTASRAEAELGESATTRPPGTSAAGYMAW